MRNLLHPRGPTEDNDAYTGPESQLTVDTDRWELRLHDGLTPGGHRILNLEQLRLLFMSKDSEFGDVAFEETDRGYLVRVGDRQYDLRAFEVGDGITVENADGVAGATKFSLDLEWLSANLIAGRILFIPLTTGTANSLQITTPEEWADLDGSILATILHVSPNGNALLQVNEGGFRPLCLMNGSRDLPKGVKKDALIFVMRAGDNYYLVGTQELPVIPDIPDQPDTLPLPLLNDWLKFGEMGDGWPGDANQIGGSRKLTPAALGLNDGECRYVVHRWWFPGTTNGQANTWAAAYIYVRIGANYYRSRNKIMPTHTQDGYGPEGYNPGRGSFDQWYSPNKAYQIGDLELLGPSFTMSFSNYTDKYFRSEKGTRYFS